MTSPETGDGRSRWVVVPEALRQGQQAVAEAGDGWQELSVWVAGQRMPDDALGWLGRVSGVTAEYNRAVERIAATYRDGAGTLDRFASSLDEVATTFEEQDADYYRAHGYVQRTLDRVRRPG